MAYISSIRNAAAEPYLATVDGWPINLPTLDKAIFRIVAYARQRRGFTVFTLNLDHLVKLRTIAAFREAYRTADLVTADGAPIALLSRLQTPGVERTTGADMFIPLAQAAALTNLPVYLFGSQPSVLDKAKDVRDRATSGSIAIAGLSSPSAEFDPEGAEADEAIETIKASGAQICFVMLGAPKQEVFAARAVARGCTAGFICVGAAADFVAGAQVRAPKAFQQLGLEWAWRLASNPRRLGRRYAECARVLFDVAVITPLRAKIQDRRI